MGGYASVTERILPAEGLGCRIVGRYGTGRDDDDVQAAPRLAVTKVPAYCRDEGADDTCVLILAHLHGVAAADRAVRDGCRLVPRDRIRRLSGLGPSLLGLGGIGAGSRSARAFGTEVTTSDPFVENRDLEGATWASPAEAAVRAAAVSSHVPMTERHRDIMKAETIAATRVAPLSANRRERPVDDDDGGAGRRSASGVALDVTGPEALSPEHPLGTMPDGIVTPDMAFHSPRATEELRARAATEIARAIAGLPAGRAVNRA